METKYFEDGFVNQVFYAVNYVKDFFKYNIIKKKEEALVKNLFYLDFKSTEKSFYVICEFKSPLFDDCYVSCCVYFDEAQQRFLFDKVESVTFDDTTFYFQSSNDFVEELKKSRYYVILNLGSDFR